MTPGRIRTALDRIGARIWEALPGIRERRLASMELASLYGDEADRESFLWYARSRWARSALVVVFVPLLLAAAVGQFLPLHPISILIVRDTIICLLAIPAFALLIVGGVAGILIDRELRSIRRHRG